MIPCNIPKKKTVVDHQRETTMEIASRFSRAYYLEITFDVKKLTPKEPPLYGEDVKFSGFFMLWLDN